MSDPSTDPLVSPDGRFEVTVEETQDRASITYDTMLTERLTNRRLFTCQGAPRAEFAADGTLTVHYAGYEPDGVQIDPARGVFRTYSSEPWVPLAAWPMVEAAYGRGWREGLDYRQKSLPILFPWLAIVLCVGSVAALLALGMQTFIRGRERTVIQLVAGAGALLFGWWTVFDINSWIQERRWAGGRGGVRRSSHHG
jgi:hypothetical protein